MRRAIWTEDETVTDCTKCHKDFSYTVYKHHCRLCGLIYCDDCTQNRLLIPEDQLVRRPQNWVKQKMPEVLENEDSYRAPKRTCNVCSHQLRGLQGGLREALSRANQELVVGDGSSFFPSLPQINFLLQNEITNATIVLNRYRSASGVDEIPKELLEIARGVVFLTIVKAGFMFTGRYGTGLVVAKLADGSWSAPSALTISGVGWGFQIGAEFTDVMLILSSEAAVQAFKSRGQLSVGAELGVSVGPIGRTIGSDVTAGDSGAAHAFSFAVSKGLFVGASLEATAIASRPDVNLAFYGEELSVDTLLSGEYPRPRGAEPLYASLREVLGSRGPRGDGSSDSTSAGRAVTTGVPVITKDFYSSSSSSSSATNTSSPAGTTTAAAGAGAGDNKKSQSSASKPKSSKMGSGTPQSQPSAGLESAEEFGLGYGNEYDGL